MSIQNKVTSTVLQAIRSRRRQNEISPAPASSGPAPKAVLRDASFADFEGVMALRRNSGWSTDSLENWHRVWKHNPALQRIQPDPPIGWVLEAEGRIVGYLGNIPLMYRYGEKYLAAATGSGLAVDPLYRALSVSLVAAFYRQKNLDLYLTTTAVEAVGKIARAFKSLPLPQSEYDSMLFWVLQPQSFANALMKKLQLRSSFSRAGGIVASLAVTTDRFLHRRWPSVPQSELKISEISVKEIGDEFQQLWEQKVSERPRLLADRSAATLRWHFDIPDDLGATQVLCCHRGANLVGYAIVRHTRSSDSEIQKSLLADMLALNDDKAALSALWAAAYQGAKRAGSHVFEVLGFPAGIREVSAKWRPYVRKYPATPFFYKAADPGFSQTLSDGGAWYACPFDGDTTLWGIGSAY